MLRRLLVVFLSYTLVFFTVACGSSVATSLPTNVCLQRANTYQNSYSIEKSESYKGREILSATDFINASVDRSAIFSSTQLGRGTKIATNVTKGVVYAEDWIHTDKEIKSRINEILSSAKLGNYATEHPELYSQFETYVKKSLQKWVPDRDYPKIGYLPKELLYDQCLGEKEITKYWPEATKGDQAKYVALTFDELVWNYELIWNDLQQNAPESLGKLLEWKR